MKRTAKLILPLMGLVLIIVSCTTVPVTGRKQMNLLPDATMLQMSLTNYQAFLKENKLSTNQNGIRMVKSSGQRITEAANLFLKKSGLEAQISNYQWEYNLIADTTPNAWCMPGGKIVVYDGLLPVARDEAGVAVVMGHEIAHAIARHGNERMSQGLVAELGGMALEKAIETQPQQTRQLFQLAYGVGAQVGFLLPYSRLHENEADRIGLILMAMAKYNPNDAVAFWERMSKSAKGPKMPVWLSTHPLDDARIAALKTNLPEAMRYYQEALAGK